jgi:hypothetical protein
MSTLIQPAMVCCLPHCVDNKYKIKDNFCLQISRKDDFTRSVSNLRRTISIFYNNILALFQMHPLHSSSERHFVELMPESLESITGQGQQK